MKRALAIVLAVASPLCADEVFLRGGGHVKGIIVERSASKVVVDVGAGRVGIPMGHVERIVEGRTALSSYLERASRLASEDVKGWLELALWAQDQDLQTQAREAFEHVAVLDPSNARAQMALGRVLVGDDWVSAEASYRARGYVPFEGSWVTPGERESILGQRREEAQAERSRAEADARVREAEARARVAEAEADRAEADASASEGGIPLWWGGGYGYGYGGPVDTGFHHGRMNGKPCHGCSPRAPEPPAPRPAPRDARPEHREYRSGSAELQR
jgi:hypothetical protein